MDRAREEAAAKIAAAPIESSKLAPPAPAPECPTSANDKHVDEGEYCRRLPVCVGREGKEGGREGGGDGTRCSCMPVVA